MCSDLKVYWILHNRIQAYVFAVSFLSSSWEIPKFIPLSWESLQTDGPFSVASVCLMGLMSGYWALTTFYREAPACHWAVSRSLSWSESEKPYFRRAVCMLSAFPQDACLAALIDLAGLYFPWSISSSHVIITTAPVTTCRTCRNLHSICLGEYGWATVSITNQLLSLGEYIHVCFGE